MLRSILTPLDGSPLSEQAIPLALSIAEREHASVELVAVHDALPPERTQTAPVIEPRFDHEQGQQMSAYLDTLASWLGRRTAVPISTELLVGRVVDSLVARVASRNPSLIVMSTHGRGGLGRALLGSVADAVVRRVEVPVLLLKPHVTGSRETTADAIHRVMIPIDGSAASEEVIEQAIAVAGRSNVIFDLVQVIVPIIPGAQLGDVPFAAGPGLQAEQDEAHRYLEQVADGLRMRGVQVETHVRMGDNAGEAILAMANELGADLIAMSTHGRGGLRRVALGSVADHVLRHAPVPVLLHRVPAGADETGNPSDSRVATNQRQR